MKSGKFTMETDPGLLDFYTLGRPYSHMSAVRPKLHQKLQKSHLIIFKGDLNYRKLVGDLDWATTTSFEDALQGFRPAPLVSLRTLKADVVVGLDRGQAEVVEKEDADWMVTGKYAVVQALL